MKLPDALVNPRRIARLEWILAALLLGLIIALLVVRVIYAGGLWRDTCGTTQLVLMPLGELLRNFDHQTLPPLFPLAYRLYLKIFGTSDNSIQAFRLLTIAGVLVAVLVTGRMSGRQAPLLLLALFGLNSVFLYWGGYAMITVALALVTPLAAGLLLQPNRARAVGLVIAALISVQLLINNLLLLSVVAIAAIVACLIRPAYKLALLFAIVLVVCVLSDLVYLHIYAAADWRILLKRPTTFGWLWPNIRAAFGEPQWFTLSVWFLVFAVTLIAAAWRLIIAWRDGDAQRARLSIFAVLLGLLAPSVYCISFLLSGIDAAESRHFLPMLGVLAPNFDLIVAHLVNHAWVRLGRIILSVAALVIIPFGSWQTMTQRQTNIDIVAHKVEQQANPNDLIIVNPWSFGISFNWYYHGAARWLTLPNISDHRIHRYDLLKEKMMSLSPLDDVKREIIATLHSGHRVWVVGILFLPNSPGKPLFPSPAPDPDFGWQHTIYREAWARQFLDFVSRRAVQARCLIAPMPNVSPQENVSLWVVEGESHQSIGP